MSRLGEEVAKIVEGLGGETTGTGDVGLEIKRIIKTLDPDASTNGGTLENVVKIRELVEEGKGGGGGSSLKSISITNGFLDSVSVMNYIDEDGKYVADSYSPVYIEAGETMTVYYPEPAEGSVWPISMSSTDITLQDEVTGVVLDENYINIDSSADDEISITITNSNSLDTN